MPKPLNYDGPFTTGQVATVIGVSPRTVGLWCDTGVIRSYKMPPTRGESQKFLRRVITLEALVEFFAGNPSVPRPSWVPGILPSSSQSEGTDARPEPKEARSDGDPDRVR